MSTNPFDNDFNQYQPLSSPSRQINNSSNTSPYHGKKHNHYSQHQHHRPATIPEHHRRSISKTLSNDLHKSSNSNSDRSSTDQAEGDPIWEARGVEWPLVSSFDLPSSRFNKLYKKSRIAGNALGIVLSYDSPGGSFGGIGGGSSHGGGNNHSFDKDIDSKAGMGDSGIGGGGYGGALGGFMGKLIRTQNQNVIGEAFPI